MYSTTEEYRQVLRAIVQMDASKYYSDEMLNVAELTQEEDPDTTETLDEFNYDDQAMTKYLDAVYMRTKSNGLFQRLYLSAAGLMLSTNPEIGLAILMSYDYLACFYLCYQSYLLSPDEFRENNQFYASLIERIERK